MRMAETATTMTKRPRTRTLGDCDVQSQPF